MHELLERIQVSVGFGFGEDQANPSHSHNKSFMMFSMLVLINTFVVLPFICTVIRSFGPVRRVFTCPPGFCIIGPAASGCGALSRLISDL